MVRVAQGGVLFRIDRLDPHQPHQAMDVLAIDPETLVPQLTLDRTAIPIEIIGNTRRFFALDPDLPVSWSLVYNSEMNG